MDEAFYLRFKLTAPQVELFRQVALGLSNQEIARTRQCSVGTAAKQVARMLRKFGVTTRRELRALLQREVPAAPVVRTPAPSSSGLAGSLSDREREVWGRVERGRSNKSIAAELGVAESTIGVFLCRARAKLSEHERALWNGRTSGISDQ
jgi:DNA-binding CsgD family transcriptional regulator